MLPLLVRYITREPEFLAGIFEVERGDSRFVDRRNVILVFAEAGDRAGNIGHGLPSTRTCARPVIQACLEQRAVRTILAICQAGFDFVQRVESPHRQGEDQRETSADDPSILADRASSGRLYLKVLATEYSITELTPASSRPFAENDVSVSCCCIDAPPLPAGRPSRM